MQICCTRQGLRATGLWPTIVWSILQELPYTKDFLPQGGANNGSVLELETVAVQQWEQLKS